MFFGAGGLMHVSAILDEGTLLSNGALRSMAIERTPGYGRSSSPTSGSARRLLILVNAYGINAALIDAALEARARGAFSSASARGACRATPAPNTRPGIRTRQNLHDVVDIAIDTKVPVGDACAGPRHRAEPPGRARPSPMPSRSTPS